jgi:hypothetical protein
MAGPSTDSSEGFVIGSRGFALTAGHVLQSVHTPEPLVAVFVDAENTWLPVSVASWELHGDEDVAVLSLEGER